MYPVKKVMAIHDMSCYGRASLTTIIPIISTLGIQVCPLLTAVLSTHMGGYGQPAITDLSDFMWLAKQHWKSLGLGFECVYTGYLASVDQVKLVRNIVKDFSNEDMLLVVDPVMADEGKLYSGFDESMVLEMRNLVKGADIITPNITEAALLLDEDYEDRFNIEIVERWAKELAEFGVKDVIITSAPSIKGEKYIDTIIYNKLEDKLTRVSVEKIDKYYPGTGDAFASVLIGKVLNNMSIEDATEFASNFVSKAITESSKYEYNSKEGILLEKVLNLLTK
ncbi:pyridoxamine kinase [uncultured Clostridium sp.]|jgi:pyridoxine kinase|uniref:pyridoxamine kinase n=1 Tax=uncultured Clostridium sp. TaxID=59620 RepID=UPI00261E5E47|nr:pyridoxamine kinase [uncultured Clostridium sp.]